jgi:hypothetical protein
MPIDTRANFFCFTGSSAPAWAHLGLGLYPTPRLWFIRARVGAPRRACDRRCGFPVHPRPRGRTSLCMLLIHMLKALPTASIDLSAKVARPP